MCLTKIYSRCLRRPCILTLLLDKSEIASASPAVYMCVVLLYDMTCTLVIHVNSWYIIASVALNLPAESGAGEDVVSIVFAFIC